MIHGKIPCQMFCVVYVVIFQIVIFFVVAEWI